jgi:hypothetical protein
MLDRDPDDAEAWVRSWAARTTTKAGAAARLADRVAVLSSQASGVDGAVRVAVASTGVVTGLWLTERARRLAVDRLAAEILATMRRAQAALVAKVSTAVAETVGEDSDTGRAVLDAYARRFPGDAGDDRS